MKVRFLIIMAIVLVVIPIGLFYFISVNGFSTFHAGIYVELLSETELERFSTNHEIKNVTKEELMQFPQIHTMVNLLLEEKENLQGTRSFFVGFDTYRIFDSHDELKIKNHMSDLGAENLSKDFRQIFGSNIIKYDRSYFAISDWIA